MKTLHRFEHGFRKDVLTGKYGYAIALSLALGSCVRDHSLGAAGNADADAGNDVQTLIDAQPSDGPLSTDLRVPDDGPLSTDLRVPDDGPLSTDLRTLDAPDVVCVANGVSYHVGDVLPPGISPCPIPCVCLSSGFFSCSGVTCPADASAADAGGLELLCLSTGGQPSSSLCCASSGDYPDSCAVGACSCAPTNSHTVNTCVCPNNGCFSPTIGCVGPTGVCTVGNDLSCNDSLAVNGTHGHCLADGRCACATGFTLIAASGKCS